MNFLNLFNQRYRHQSKAFLKEFMKMQEAPEMNPPIYAAYSQVIEALKKLTLRVNSSLQAEAQNYALKFTLKPSGAELLLQEFDTQKQLLYSYSLLGEVTPLQNYWRFLTEKNKFLDQLPLSASQRIWLTQKKETVGPCKNQNLLPYFFVLPEDKLPYLSLPYFREALVNGERQKANTLTPENLELSSHELLLKKLLAKGIRPQGFEKSKNRFLETEEGEYFVGLSQSNALGLSPAESAKNQENSEKAKTAFYAARSELLEQNDHNRASNERNEIDRFIVLLEEDFRSDGVDMFYGSTPCRWYSHYNRGFGGGGEESEEGKVCTSVLNAFKEKLTAAGVQAPIAPHPLSDLTLAFLSTSDSNFSLLKKTITETNTSASFKVLPWQDKATQGLEVKIGTTSFYFSTSEGKLLEKNAKGQKVQTPTALTPTQPEATSTTRQSTPLRIYPNQRTIVRHMPKHSLSVRNYGDGHQTTTSWTGRHYISHAK